MLTSFGFDMEQLLLIVVAMHDSEIPVAEQVPRDRRNAPVEGLRYLASMHYAL